MRTSEPLKPISEHFTSKTMSKAIYDVVVQIHAPTETSHGQVAEGRYVFEDKSSRS
jgi:hypothetical protein